jgi:predicted transcriptional regulator of viral defense system
MDQAEKILALFDKHGGYARMKELKAASVQTRELARLVQDGIVEKIKPGLYRLSNLSQTNGIPTSFIDVCRAIPDGVICLLSALDFHGLTTFNPSEVYVAVPHSAKPPRIEYPPIRVFYFRDRFYDFGIEHREAAKGVVRIYDKEKTICDMFRYRKKLGEDLALEALKNYLALEEAKINKVQVYAAHCQVKTVMAPYIRAMITE